jgi:hypothetical protein
MHRKHDVQAFSKHRQKHRRAMFLSEHRLNIPSLRNGKHPIVKNIPSLRNVKIPQPWWEGGRLFDRSTKFFTETAVTPEQKVEKSFPRWEINRHAKG